MSVLLVTVAFLMLSAPLLTEGVWRALYQHEAAQINLDNEGVRLGQSLRALMALQLSWEMRFKLLEKEHHRIHLCGAECLAADRAWELRLEASAEESERELRSHWAELLMLAARVDGLPKVFPFERTPCAVCGGRWAWRWRPGELPLLLRLSDTSAAPAYVCLLEGLDQYWMFAEEHRAREFCH